MAFGKIKEIVKHQQGIQTLNAAQADKFLVQLAEIPQLKKDEAGSFNYKFYVKLSDHMNRSELQNFTLRNTEDNNLVEGSNHMPQCLVDGDVVKDTKNLAINSKKSKGKIWQLDEGFKTIFKKIDNNKPEEVTALLKTYQIYEFVKDVRKSVSQNGHISTARIDRLANELVNAEYNDKFEHKQVNGNEVTIKNAKGTRLFNESEAKDLRDNISKALNTQLIAAPSR